MKKLSLFGILFVTLFLAVLASSSVSATAETAEPTFANAHEIVDFITAGWNLGNTLDAHPHGFTATGSDPENWTPEIQETFWGNPLTTRENILTIRDAGFNAIRIPITFYTMIDEDFNIREDWMNRIVEIVDYAYDAGMIVIINTHHDERLIGLGLTDEEGNLVPQYSNHPDRATLVTVDDSVRFITTIWEQLSETFADYGSRLIFEGLNEPRTIGSPAEWNGGTQVERENLNRLNQLFVDTVRAHGGGYNDNRFLMVPTYAAAVGVQAFDGWIMPTDPAGPDHLIVSLHAYTPWRFALDTSLESVSEWSIEGSDHPEGQDSAAPIDWALNLSRDTFPNYPIIIGEMGALNRDNLESRIAWTTYYHTLARELDMRVFWWDNGQFGIQQIPWGPDQFAIFDRRTNTFPFPELVYVLTGYLPESVPTPDPDPEPTPDPDPEPPVEEIEVPTNLYIDTSGILTWDGVEGATDYRIYVNPTVEVQITSFDLTTLALEPGVYEVQVRAVGEHTYSELSEAIQFIVTIEEELEKDLDEEEEPKVDETDQPNRGTLPATGTTLLPVLLIGSVLAGAGGMTAAIKKVNLRSNK